MTEGRFETTYNLRNSDFENRKHWTKSHRVPEERARYHREQESCPYHDLRANGCFMPHMGDSIGGDKGTISAPQLMTRPSGEPMRTQLARNKNTGCGGAILPEDTDPLPPVPVPKRNAAPWSSTGKAKGLFSVPPYISAPDIEKPKQQYEPPFHTGASNTTLGKPYAFVPGDCTKKLPPPTAFRLKAGTYKGAPLPPVARLAGLAPRNIGTAPGNGGNGDSGKKQKKTNFKVREPFRDGKTLQGTFGKVSEHLPTPYTDAKLNAQRNFTLFTYAAKSKRGMPVQCTWDSSPNAVKV